MIRYRQILIFAATILAVVGCERSDLESDDLNTAQRAITYSSTVEATKATEAKIETLQEYGKFNIATFLTDTDETHYYTDEVSYADYEWTGDVTRYWPVSYNLNMFAYSPIEDFIVINNTEDYSNYSMEYTCPVDIDDQVDLLVKTLKNQSPNDGAVDLEFQHALSSIEFKIEIEGENNITLDTIAINYVNIEKQRTYNFSEEEWVVPESESAIYFDAEGGLSTTLTVYETKTATTTDSSVTFDEIDNQLMIIPQSISSSASDPHYISIQITYSLNSGQDEESVEVTTGVMPLPAPDSSNSYAKGYLYTYNVVVNGQTITFSSISIEDQESPVAAYGNIDLGLIETPISYSDYVAAAGTYTKADTDTEETHYYYATAVRVAQLLADGVRDFVVVGSFGDDTEHSDGKLGYYGSESSPFFIAASSLGMMPNYTIDTTEDYDNLVFETPNAGNLFSIDLRGVYGFPTFGSTHDVSTLTTDDVTLSAEAPILTNGIFRDLALLDEVIFPQGLSAIGEYSFQNCISLSSVDIAEVIHIEEGAFVDCIGLKEVLNGELTRVHAHGFDNCKSLEIIELGGVLEVDEFGFVDCSSLTEVDLSKLTTIGEHAFSGCSKLTLSSDIPSSAFEAVADYAFNGCSQLGVNDTKIDLTSTITVGKFAFYDCTQIKLSDGDLDEMLEIGQYAFTDCVHIGSTYEISMPQIKSIGTAAFQGCTEINIIEGLGNLTEISVSAFQDCESLTGYSAGETDVEKKLLSLPNVVTVGDFGLSGTGLTSVEFDANVLIEIGGYAFNNSAQLVSISGLEGVTSVGNYAFANCTQLEELILPQLTSGNCGDALFSFCTSLKKVSLPLLTNNITGSWIDDYGVEQSTTIIGMISADFKAIESIDLRGLVLDIPGWHITDKPNLVYVNLASATSVGNGGFAGCSALETLDLSSAKSVGDYAFQGCTALEGLLLSSLEGSFGDWQYFSENSNLKYLDLASLEEVVSMTFQSNTSLLAIDLRSATSVGAYAFQNCTALERLNLSSLLSSGIGDGAFDGIAAGQCEIWLSDKEADTVADGTTTWAGVTWKAIHSVTNGDVFSLY